MPRPKLATSYRDNMDETRDSLSDVSVVDVYDLASDIGKECEKIIDLYGAAAVKGLMPRVITALELLEQLATRNEQENAQLLELQNKVSLLENDKIEKAEYRAKFERVCCCYEFWNATFQSQISSFAFTLSEKGKPYCCSFEF